MKCALRARQQVTDSPVELIEIVLRHQPEIGPKEKQNERTAQDDEPRTLPLQKKTPVSAKRQV